MMRAAVHVSALVLLLATAGGAAAPPSIDVAFQKFWSARNPDDAAKAAVGVVSSGVTFDAALARLKGGRSYSSQVKHGLVHLQRPSVMGAFFYDLAVPEAYDPTHAYQVRLQLHGGVMMRESSEPRAGAAAAVARASRCPAPSRST